MGPININEVPNERERERGRERGGEREGEREREREREYMKIVLLNNAINFGAKMTSL